MSEEKKVLVKWSCNCGHHISDIVTKEQQAEIQQPTAQQVYSMYPKCEL